MQKLFLCYKLKELGLRSDKVKRLFLFFLGVIILLSGCQQEPTVSKYERGLRYLIAEQYDEALPYLRDELSSETYTDLQQTFEHIQLSNDEQTPLNINEVSILVEKLPRDIQTILKEQIDELNIEAVDEESPKNLLLPIEKLMKEENWSAAERAIEEALSKESLSEEERSTLTTYKQLIPLQQSAPKTNQTQESQPSNKVTQNTPPPPPSSRQGVIDHLESQVNLNEYLAQIQKGVVQAYQGNTQTARNIIQQYMGEYETERLLSAIAQGESMKDVQLWHMPGYLGGYTFNDYVNVTSNTEVAVSYEIHDCSESFSTTYIYLLSDRRHPLQKM